MSKKLYELIAKIMNVPATSIDDNSKAEIIAGYRLRYADINVVKEYARINGHYEPLTADNKKAIEVIKLSVDYVMSYSQQQFGHQQH